MAEPVHRLTITSRLEDDDDDVPLAQLVGAPKAPAASKASVVPPSKATSAAAAKTPNAPAAKSKPKAKSSEVPKAAGKAAANGPPKAKGRPSVASSVGSKRKRDDADESDSSTTSSGSESSDEEDSAGETPNGAKKGGATSKAAMRRSVKARKSAMDEEEEAADRARESAALGAKLRQRSPKQKVVAELLCRWWYAMPDWPPAEEEFYTKRLEERKLRKVAIEEWEWVPEEDSQGRKKVYELSQFRGLFRASSGELIDLRPQDTCPSQATFSKWDMPKLLTHLLSAYETQLKELKNSKYDETNLERELQKQIVATRDQLRKAQIVNGRKK